jgi:hypothetical protein
MSRFVRVEGYLEIEDEDFDPGPLGPLTQEADERERGFGSGSGSGSSLADLEDLTFGPDDR